MRIIDDSLKPRCAVPLRIAPVAGVLNEGATPLDGDVDLGSASSRSGDRVISALLSVIKE